VIRDNLQRIEERLEAAAARAGRKRSEIDLMVVSKTQTVESIQEVYDAGHRLFGENRVLEAGEKFRGRFPDAELHLIGHIQRNKARQAVEIAACIQSLDSERTLTALEKHAASLERVIKVLVEVNTSREDSKQGVAGQDELFRLYEAIGACSHIIPAGLMTMAPFTTEEEPVRRAFRKLRSLGEECAARFGRERAGILSMGMSGDFEIAVEEGSTLVRVGTAVFGARR
jgi:pyridoxal phosphate enzyme (YggS family)